MTAETERPPRGFKRFRRRAESLVNNRHKVREVVDEASEKLSAHRGQLGGLKSDLPTLLRLVRAWVRRDYKLVPWKSLVLATAAALYFVNPFDLTPDAIPGLGFLDDAAVVAYVIRSIHSTLEDFRAWETDQQA
jgi:uncharacterized membrane protein YkvA (DUF1232 family)